MEQQPVNSDVIDDAVGTPLAAGPVSSDEIEAALGPDAPAPLQDLLAQSRRVVFEPQQVLYNQGSDCTCVLFITGGLLKLLAYLRNGRARIVRLHRQESVIGLSGLLQHQHNHTAVAITRVSALQVPISALELLRSEQPASYITLLENWHSYLEEADVWITHFSTGTIPGRLAHLLTFLVDIQDNDHDSELQLLSCEDMGFILGVTTESVSRSLAEFKRNNLLVYEDRDGRIEYYDADLEGLRLIAAEQ